jgi:hypothetical protein
MDQSAHARCDDEDIACGTNFMTMSVASLKEWHAWTFQALCFGAFIRSTRLDSPHLAVFLLVVIFLFLCAVPYYTSFSSFFPRILPAQDLTTSVKHFAPEKGSLNMPRIFTTDLKVPCRVPELYQPDHLFHHTLSLRMMRMEMCSCSK